jgi:hypothetical protein
VKFTANRNANTNQGGSKMDINDTARLIMLARRNGKKFKPKQSHRARS